jgi:lactate 2-monooxygenase
MLSGAAERDLSIDLVGLRLPAPVRMAPLGGLGVMTDDMIAGLMAGMLVVAARYFFHL